MFWGGSRSMSGAHRPPGSCLGSTCCLTPSVTPREQPGLLTCTTLPIRTSSPSPADTICLPSKDRVSDFADMWRMAVFFIRLRDTLFPVGSIQYRLFRPVYRFFASRLRSPKGARPRRRLRDANEHPCASSSAKCQRKEKGRRQFRPKSKGSPDPEARFAHLWSRSSAIGSVLAVFLHRRAVIPHRPAGAAKPEQCVDRPPRCHS